MYYQRKALGAYDLELMRLIDAEHLRTPVYGSRRMSAHLNRQGYAVNRKRVQRLMREMGLQAIYPKPCTSRPGVGGICQHSWHMKWFWLFKILLPAVPDPAPDSDALSPADRVSGCRLTTAPGDAASRPR
ncbi:IS3 family transposase, partial [Cobetia sp.]|uniref:IS3 family transposase n=1 Tax=Cobetia sp. TaxID=1873876 RepID=UPI00338DA614